VIAKAACSLDGKIATRSGDSQWLTGPKAREIGHRLRHDCDAILVGVGTVLADDPQLTTRLPRRRAKDPIRLVLDSKLRLPPTARLLHPESTAPTWIATTPAAPQDKILDLEDMGITVLIMSGDGDRVDLESLLAELGCRQVQSLLVEGGAEILGAFFDRNLVDKFYFFYAPKFLGGQQALSVIGGAGVDRLAKAHQARDLALRRLGPDFLVTGYLEK